MIPDMSHPRSAVQSKKVKQILLILICAISFGCKSSAADHGVEFVDRSAAFSQGALPQPLMLIVEIDVGGRLRLNKIETGTTRDMSLLVEKLDVILADREKTGIDEREVLIDPKILPETESLEELIRVLADAKASPIRVIRNDR
jgi:hypothetical protein